MAAARALACPSSLAGRSRSGSRRSSSLGPSACSAGSSTPAGALRSSGAASAAAAGIPTAAAAAGPFTSPLRHSSISVVVARSGCGEDASSGAPSPLALERAQPEALFERFGSCEGLSAAVDDFYHRLCGDSRIGASVKEVPEQDVRYLMMQLMALSLQQQQNEGALGADHSEERRSWSRDCRSLLRRAGAHPPDLTSEGGADAVYEAVMGAMLTTLEALGASREQMEARQGAGWAFWRGGGAGGSGSGGADGLVDGPELSPLEAAATVGGVV